MQKLLVLLIVMLVLLYSVNAVFSQNSTEATESLNNIDMNVSNFVYDANSRPFNTSYSDWTAKWWQWAYSIPLDRNPSYDDTGKYCNENQVSPVWFLTQAYEHPVTRTCEIPQGTALLITLLNSECSYAEFPSLKSEQELRDCAKTMQDIVIGMHATLDGNNIPSLELYRVQSGLFNFTLPENNILNLTSQITQSVSDGNWLFLKPLPPGTHELIVKGDINSTKSLSTFHGYEFAGPVGWNQTTTYILNVW
ncbi:MAG TPA: hypothetical protein VD710_04045 [Nitrososphaeraceae archaeon]|nr:hypothetical protein [Nitrososphaeraceae archaeon]